MTGAGARADAFHRRVQRYGWDRAVHDYAAYWEPVLAGCARRALTSAQPRLGDRALDVACGTGAATLLLAEAVGPSGSVLGVDLSAEMVLAAERRAAGAGLRHARFERMDAEALALPGGSFDVVLCVLGLMYPANPAAAIAEMTRVLRPGGRCAAVVWGRREQCGWRDVFSIVNARVRSEVCPMFYALGRAGALAGALARAGLSDVADECWQESLWFDSAAAAVGAALAGGPVALAYSRFDPATRRAVEHEYLSSILAYRSGRGYAIPGEFVIACGTKGAST